ncbi:MAG TPA: NAD(P)-binding protein [Candidatus Margulisiibacteriota bacterium]|nr:NAD(P)-binding protein [Candidatus Margulisiibacteriota bacterium]
MADKINSKSYECCIIGAGPAGLGVAYELAKHGITDTLVIDKNKGVGGLTRTDVLDGARFDIGPHRFFTKNKEVNKIWHDTLGNDFQPVSRLTRIYYKNKYFNYPIRPADVLIKLGPVDSLITILSFFSSQVSKKNELLTFEDWIVRKFGRKLYETFFKTYTEKVWGIPCNQIGAEWAAQRTKGLDALELLKNALFAGKKRKIKTIVEEFDFPVLGAGQMYEAISDKLTSQGVELMLEGNVIRFNRQDNSIKSISCLKTDGQEVEVTAKQFFSSIPLARFFKMLNPPDPYQIINAAEKLRYRDHITVDLLIGKKNVFPDQWFYIHSPDVQIARIANYKNFSKSMVKDQNKTGLSVEYFAFKSDNIWNRTDESLSELAVGELDKMHFIKRCEVEKAWVVREADAYPVYDLSFQEHLDLLKSRIGQFANFYSVGRAGMHKYNNQDHSLISGILAARNYLKLPGSPFMLWDINAEAEYHENAQRG